MDLIHQRSIRLSEQNEYEAMLIFVAISMPSFIKCVKFYFPHNTVGKWFAITASQYTNWNICLVVINHFYNNRFMNLFLTINSTTIFIVYHMFYLTNKPLIKQIPNIPEFCNDYHINIVNVIVHVVPFIGYIYDFYKNRYLVDTIDYNAGYNVIFFNMIWALQCFQSFDPHTVYFQVSYSNVYKMWVLIIILNLSVGFCLQHDAFYYVNKYVVK